MNDGITNPQVEAAIETLVDAVPDYATANEISAVAEILPALMQIYSSGFSEGEKFAACYWDTPDGRVFSLRSTDDGMDVSEIAKVFGGGGHEHASGFKVPLGASVS